MHQPGIIADIKRCPFQAGIGFEKGNPPDQINAPVFRDAVQEILHGAPLRLMAEHGNGCPRQEALVASQARHQIRKAVLGPGLALPIGRGSDGQNRAFLGHQAIRRGAVRIGDPDRRRRHLVGDPHDLGITFKPVARPLAPHAEFPGGRDQIGQGRVAQVDQDRPPPPDAFRPQPQPMQGIGLFIQDNDPLQAGHGIEQGGCGPPAGDGHTGPRVIPDQTAQNPHGQDRVTDPRRRDEQDAFCHNLSFLGLFQPGDFMGGFPPIPWLQPILYIPRLIGPPSPVA